MNLNLFPLFSSFAIELSVPAPLVAREWVANVQFSSGDHPITTQTKLNWPNDVLPKLPLATTHKGHVWRTGIQNKWYLSRSLPAYAPSKYIQWVLGNFMLSNFCFAFQEFTIYPWSKFYAQQIRTRLRSRLMWYQILIWYETWIKVVGIILRWSLFRRKPVGGCCWFLVAVGECWLLVVGGC